MPATITSSTDKLLTMREAAARLNISARTVWAMIQDGRLRAIRIGRAVRIAPAELERYILDATEGADDGK